MCGRYYINDETAREIEKLVRQVNEKLIKDKLLMNERDIYPSAKAPVIIGERTEDENEELSVAEYTWGLPHFDKSKKIIFNARAESVLEKRMFRESTLKRRLIVPASGFYEWNGNKDKYFFKSKDDNILLFAGIYSGDRFVILTTAANETIKDVHHRMPLILNPREIDEWIFDEKAVPEILQKKPQQLEKELANQAGMDGQMSLFDLW